MAQDLPVLLVGAGLILLGFAMLTAVVAVGVAVLLAKRAFRRGVNRLLR